MLPRRTFITAGGLALAGLAGPRVGRAARIVEIRMRSDAQGAEVWFDPIGVVIAPGDPVRWIVAQNVHTTTAYHPRNDHHSLRGARGAVGFGLSRESRTEVRSHAHGRRRL